MKLRSRKNKDGTTMYFADYREAGRRIQKRLGKFSTKHLADIAFGDFLRRRERGEIDIPTQSGLTVGQCLTDYIEAKKVNWTEGHSKPTEARKREIEKHLGAMLPIQSLTEKQVGEFVKVLRTKGDKATTINRKIGLLKAAIDKAVREGRVAKNPLEGMERLSDRAGDDEVWTFLEENEIERLLDVCRNGTIEKVERSNGRDYDQKIPPPKGLYPLVLFLLNTGARRGEALALRWSDVDLRAGAVRLLTTKRAAKGRAAKSRHIPINETLRELFEGMERGARDAKVFSISWNNIRRKFKRTCELAEIQKCRVHDLRHTFASHLAMRGTPLTVIRELLGHSTLTMTLRYAHLTPDVKADAVAGLNFGATGEMGRVVAVHER